MGCGKPFLCIMLNHRYTPGLSAKERSCNISSCYVTFWCISNLVNIRNQNSLEQQRIMLVCNIFIFVLLWASASAFPTSEPHHLEKRLAVGTEASYANMAVSAIEKVIMKEKPMNNECIKWIKIKETRFQWRCKKFG